MAIVKAWGEDRFQDQLRVSSQLIHQAYSKFSWIPWSHWLVENLGRDARYGGVDIAPFDWLEPGEEQS